MFSDDTAILTTRSKIEEMLNKFLKVCSAISKRVSKENRELNVTE